jgi:hypothetical protein
VEVKEFPPDLDRERYVEAIIMGMGVSPEYTDFFYQVDCSGIVGKVRAQVFTVAVAIEAEDEVARLNWIRLSRVILDPKRERPQYLQLSDNEIVECTVLYSRP